MWRCLSIAVLVAGGLVSGGSNALAGAPDDTTPDDTNPDEPAPDDTAPDDELDGGTGVVSGGTGTDAPAVTLPVIPVPVGCAAPTLPHIVFTGTVVDRDFRTIRFEIDQVRTGTGAPFALDDRIDVRYGLDVQYLADGEAYLVSAVVDPDLGLLVSHVTDPIEH